MGARSLRSKQEKLQRGRRFVQHYEVSSPVSSLPNMLTSSPAYNPPALAPGPSADGSAHHHAVPTGAIVGGGIASCLALAATAIIVAAIYGKAGLTRLLAPIYCKLLSSCLLGNLLRSERLKSLRNIFPRKRHSHHKRRKSKEADDNDTNEGSSRADSGHRDLLSEILGGGSPSTRASKKESTARPEHSSTASMPLEDIVKDQVEQLQTSIHAYLVTTVSDLVESELREAKEEMRQQSVHESIPKTQGYAKPLIFSVAETVIDDLRFVNDEVGKVEANAKSGEASSEGIAAMWTQPVDTALLIVEEAFKIGADIASTSASTVTEESELIEEEAALHRKRRGRRLRAKNPDVEADVSGQEELRQTVLLDDDCIKSGKVYEEQKSTFTELQVLEETGSDPASHKKRTNEGASAGCPASHKQETSEAASGDTHSLALVPTADTGGIVTNNVAPTETMISKPTTAVLSMQRKLRRSTKKGKSARNEVILKASSKKRKQLGHGIVTNNTAQMGTMISMLTKAVVPLQETKKLDTQLKWEGKDAISKGSKSKCKRPSNLGHVSFLCEMSAQRLRFFTSCMSGGTYGSPMPSLDHTVSNNHNDHRHHQDINIHHHGNNTNRINFPSIDEPNSAHRQFYVPLHNAYQYNLMHQQQYEPSKSILAQRITRSEASSSMQHIAPVSIAHVDFIESPPKSSNIDDYGGPFDGVL